MRLQAAQYASIAVLIVAPCAGCVSVQLPEARIITSTPEESLTWRRAVELALVQHPDLREAREELKSKAHSRNAALGDYLPGVDGSFSRKRSRTTNTAATGDTFSFDLNAEQPLFTGFKTTGEYLKAKRAWEAETWAYRDTSAAIRLRLRSAFVGLLRLRELIRVNRRIAERRTENADLLQLRYEAGREHRGSMMRAQAIADQAAFDLRQTQRTIESQALVFSRELGGQFWLAIEVAGDLEQMVPDVSEQQPDYPVLAENTPDVQRLIKTAESKKASVLVAQGKLWPEVKGTYNYGYSGSTISNLRDDASLLLTVSVPLFQGGQNIEGVLQARADYRAAVEAARSARDDAISVLAMQWVALRDARELLEVRRAFLEASRERAEVVRSQYTSGLVDFQDFDIAEQELADSEKFYVRALADVTIQQAEWERDLGETLEDALEHN